MNATIELALALAASALVAVGSVMVIIPKVTTEEAAVQQQEVLVKCVSQDEGGKCLQVKVMTPEEVVEVMMTQREKVERLEDAVESIRKKLDRIEEQTKEVPKK